MIRAGDLVEYKGEQHRVLVDLDDSQCYLPVNDEPILVQKSRLTLINRDWSDEEGAA